MALFSGLKKQKHEKIATSDSDANATDSDDSGGGEAEGNTGWADSIAKVLATTKPKTKKILVLSRAKKIKVDETKESTKSYGFEIDGEVKEEKPTQTELAETLKKRKNMQLALRVKPTWKDIERERTLRKVATRGVVQLFNAVRIQQKDLKMQLDEAGPLDSRKDAILNNIDKRKFLDVLMGGKRSKSEAIDNSVKNEYKNEDDASSDDDDEGTAGKRKKSEWNVLRDDFMTNKKIKHWDEEDDSEKSESNETDGDTEEDDD